MRAAEGKVKLNTDLSALTTNRKEGLRVRARASPLNTDWATFFVTRSLLSARGAVLLELHSEINKRRLVVYSYIFLLISLPTTLVP